MDAGTEPPHLCPRCASDLIQPLAYRPRGALVAVAQRCPECGWRGERLLDPVSLSVLLDIHREATALLRAALVPRRRRRRVGSLAGCVAPAVAATPAPLPYRLHTGAPFPDGRPHRHMRPGRPAGRRPTTPAARPEHPIPGRSPGGPT